MKVEKILKDSLDLIPSPSPSMKIQIIRMNVQNQSGPSNGILHRFCLTGGSTLTSQDYDPSSVVYVSKPIRAI